MKQWRIAFFGHFNTIDSLLQEELRNLVSQALAVSDKSCGASVVRALSSMPKVFQHRHKPKRQVAFLTSAERNFCRWYRQDSSKDARALSGRPRSVTCSAGSVLVSTKRACERNSPRSPYVTVGHGQMCEKYILSKRWSSCWSASPLGIFPSISTRDIGCPRRSSYGGGASEGPALEVGSKGKNELRAEDCWERLTVHAQHCDSLPYCKLGGCILEAWPHRLVSFSHLFTPWRLCVEIKMLSFLSLRLSGRRKDVLTMQGTSTSTTQLRVVE